MPQPSDATAFPRMTSVPDKANTIILVDEKVASDFVTKGLPTSVLEAAIAGAGANGFLGSFNPTGPTPNLQNGTGIAGTWYRVSADGSHDFGAGSIALKTNQTVYYADDATWKLDAGGQFITGDKTKLDAINSWEFSASDLSNWASGAIVTETTTQAPGGFLYAVNDNSAGGALYREWTEANLEPGSDYQWDFWFKTQTSPAHYMAFEIDNGEAATTITKVNLATAAVYEVTGGSVQVFATNWNIGGGLYRIRFLIRPLKSQIVIRIYPSHGAAANAGNDTAVDITQQGTVDILPTEIKRGLRDTSLLHTANVKAYGATGNGTTNDTTAIQAAFNSGATRVYFPTGNYLVTSKITVPAAVVDVFGDGPSASRLFGNFTAAAVLEVVGTTPTSLGGVTANLPQGDPQFTLSSAPSGLLVGRDVALISDSGATNWSTWNANYRKGEMPLVNAVSSATVYLSGGLYDSYTQANVTVGQLHYRPFRLANMMLENQEIGFFGKFLNGYVLDNVLVKIEGTTAGNAGHGIRLFHCFGGQLLNCNSTVSSDTSGDRYAIAWINSQNLSIVGGTYVSPRHALTTGGVGGSPSLSNPMNPCRNLRLFGISAISSNFHNQTADSPIDTHGNTEDVLVSNCTLRGGGFLVGGDHLTYEGCHIFLANKSIGNTGWLVTEPRGPNITIANCVVHITREVDGYAFLMNSFDTGLDRPGQISISNVRVHTPGGGGGPRVFRFQQQAGEVATASYVDILMVGNKLINGGSAVPLFLQLDAPTAGDEVVRNITLIGNSSDAPDGRIDYTLTSTTAFKGRFIKDGHHAPYRSGFFTTTATQTLLWEMPTVADRAYHITAKIIGVRGTYALADTRHFRLTASFVNDAGTVSQVGTTVTEIDLPQTSPPAVSVTFAIDAVNDKIQLKVTGLAQTWFWNANVEVMTDAS